MVLVEARSVESAVMKFSGGLRTWGLSRGGVDYFRVEGDQAVYRIDFHRAGTIAKTGPFSAIESPHTYSIRVADDVLIEVL